MGKSVGNSVNNFMAPNARALNQLRSWLGAVGIEHKPSAAGNDLTVKRADGTEVEVQVAMDVAKGPEDVLVVQGPSLTGRKLGDALRVFDDLQVTLGYSAKPPVNRGPIPKKKAHFTDDFELVALRHMELRRSPNPDPKALKQLDPVITRATWSFYNRNRQVCDDHMLEFGDLKDYALAWAVSFLGLHSVPAERVRDYDNEKLLALYLGQRFSNFRDTLNRKSRNLFPSLDTASIAQNDTPYDYENFESWGSTKGEKEDVEQDEEYIARHRELDVHSPSARRSSASIALDESLGALSHDEMIVALTQASENTRIHPDAQRLAARKLRDHATTCEACAHLVSAPEAEELDDVAGPETDGDVE